MTTFAPICSFCKYFSAEVRDKEVCKAFPDGIPVSVLTGKTDHRMPIEGDHGVQFKPVKGFEYLDAPKEQVM